MNYYFWSGVINAVTSFSVAALVFLKNRQTRANQIFIIFAASVGFWALCYAVWIWTMTYSDDQHALFWIRLAMIGSTIIPPAFTEFVIHLLKHEQKWTKIRFFNMLLMVIILLFSFSPYFIKGVSQIMSFRYWPGPGPLFYVFHAWFGGNVAASHYLLIESLWKTKGTIVWKRNFSVFIGTLIGFLGGMTNHFLWYKIKIPPIGNIFVAVYVATVAFSIIRYRLFDIEVIIKKTLVFAGLSSFVIACFSIPLFLLPRFFAESITKELQLWLLVIAGMVVASVVGPLNRILIDITDRYLFQKKINYRLLLREASEYLAHVDSLKHQARTIVVFLLKKARIANAAVYAFAAPDRSSLLLKASRPHISNDKLQRISLLHPLIEYFHHHEEPIEINMLSDMRDDSVLKPEDFREIESLMHSLRAEAAVPCYGGEAASKFDKKSFRLKGILFLGHQKSDEPYSEEDLDVFFTLAQESSIAFENARLYDEAVNRAIELQKMNEELKKTHAALLEEKKRAVLAGLGKSMAHEIRNPITPINSHLYFGRKRLREMKNVYEANLSKPSEANHQKFLTNFNSAMELLAEIEKSKDRIQGIVNTLYNLVAQKTGNKVEVKLDMVAESAIEEVKYQNYWETLNQPDIENRIPRQLPFVLGIPQDIQGVFVNLIINALHAMEKTVDKRITIDAVIDQDNPNMIKIEFSDNGCGIPVELQEKIFEHGFTTKGGKGTGLGLFYCKNIIEQVHGGTINVKRQVGAGTCFTIRLPRFKKEDEKREP